MRTVAKKQSIKFMMTAYNFNKMDLTSNRDLELVWEIIMWLKWVKRKYLGTLLYVCEVTLFMHWVNTKLLRVKGYDAEWILWIVADEENSVFTNLCIQPTGSNVFDAGINLISPLWKQQKTFLYNNYNIWSTHLWLNWIQNCLTIYFPLVHLESIILSKLCMYFVEINISFILCFATLEQQKRTNNNFAIASHSRSSNE